MVNDLNTVLESAGFLEPGNKVYILAKDLDYMSINMMLLTLFAGTQLHYDLNVNSLVRKSKHHAIDGPYFIMGLLTILRVKVV
jgi:hypothetical protein